MNIVVFKGGLGNQLFQYVFYKYLSKKSEFLIFMIMLDITLVIIVLN